MTALLQAVGVLGMAVVGVALVVIFAALLVGALATVRREWDR